jgi:hypothetical protein
VDRSQAWFGQREHQVGEREASEQAARGEGEQVASGQEFLDSLD